jgi:hypothetical protein
MLPSDDDASASAKRVITLTEGAPTEYSQQGAPYTFRQENDLTTFASADAK